MKMQNFFTGVITCLLCAAMYSHGAETRPVSPGEYRGNCRKTRQDLIVIPDLTADSLWEIFLTDTVPKGVTNLTVRVAHDGRAYGSYANFPTIANIDVIDGILLTSGWATYAIGPNNSDGDYYGTNPISAPNDPDLDDIINNASYPTFDATYFIVEFDTDTSVKGISFDFVYGSEEFPEFVGNIFNDLFCCFLDGENISYDGNGQVINVNNDYFLVDNLDDHLNLQFDGFTPLLRTSDSLTAGHHVIKFAIADVSDDILTSGVFLSNFRFRYTGSGTVPVKELIDNQQFSVLENSPAGTFVGEVKIKVPDSMGVTLEIYNGVPEFDFDDNTREITVANGADLDYEKQNVYAFQMIATAYDTVHDTAAITINIIDYSVGDLISDQTFYVKEKSQAGTFVGGVQLNAPDSIDVSLEVIQDVPEFDFTTSSREITVANGADLDFEKQDTYYMKLEAAAKEATDDTALITIKILDSLEIAEPPDIDSAVMYDTNGDGIGDSAHVVFKGSLNTFKPDEADLEWPDNGDSYNLTIQSSQVNGTELALPFTPATSTGVLTTGTGNVSVYFDSTGSSFTRKGTVLDGIGPLLKDTAYVVERFGPGIDTFFVKFTEDVKIDEIDGESFTLLKNSQEIAVEIIGGVQSISGEIQITFAADLKGANPQVGDSLKILHTGPVADKRNNKAHKNNAPVPIAILNRPVPVTAAAYYDTDGDGVVDQVRITFDDEIDKPQSFKATFTWESGGEKGAVDGLEYLSSGNHKVLKAEIRDIFGVLLKDRTSGEMTMLLEYRDFMGFTTGHTVSDKAAPVITQATYCPNGDFSADGQQVGFDTLVVCFSEEVSDIDSKVPFDLLAVETGNNYHFELKQMSHKAKLVLFEVEEVVDVDYPIDGDSIRIDYKENVEDVKGNSQKVEKNKRVRMTVRERPFNFIITVIGPVNPEHNTIPTDLLTDNITIEKGIVILLDPVIDIPEDKIASTNCAITIYDAVGNYITACDGINDDNPKLQMDAVNINGKYKIVIVWTGQNENGRAVGEGSYLGRIAVTYPRGNAVVFDVMVGVMR